MSSLLYQALTESGYEVSVAENGEIGLNKAPGHDLLIVDVMMPILNGFAMVKQLRQGGTTTPVLFLTAKDTADDQVTGLDLGGDDYLVKPFPLSVLLARTRALLRRTQADRDEIRIADVVLFRRQRRVERAGRALFLSNTEFALLELFLLHPSEILSKATLLKEVWNDDGERDDNVVEVYINYLRTKLEVHGQSRLLHTVRGRGYVLEAPHP